MIINQSFATNAFSMHCYYLTIFLSLWATSTRQDYCNFSHADPAGIAIIDFGGYMRKLCVTNTWQFEKVRPRVLVTLQEMSQLLQSDFSLIFFQSARDSSAHITLERTKSTILRSSSRSAISCLITDY